MKKIAICGKGGSGKSTTAALLANRISNRGYRVVVIDSDESNSGLYRMLGFNEPPVPFMDYLGGKKNIKQKMSPKPSAGKPETKTMVLSQDEIRIPDIPSEYRSSKDNLSLLSIGKIVHSLEGCACPMGVLSREFLGKLKLESNEIAIIDMEAGVEHFGRGVEASIDSIVIVVEPSFESIELTERMTKFASDIGISNIWVVLNKVTSEELIAKLRDKLLDKNIDVIGSIHFDADIFEAAFEGHPTHGQKAAEDVDRILDVLLGERTT